MVYAEDCIYHSFSIRVCQSPILNFDSMGKGRSVGYGRSMSIETTQLL